MSSQPLLLLALGVVAAFLFGGANSVHLSNADDTDLEETHSLSSERQLATPSSFMLSFAPTLDQRLPNDDSAAHTSDPKILFDLNLTPPTSPESDFTMDPAPLSAVFTDCIQQFLNEQRSQTSIEINTIDDLSFKTRFYLTRRLCVLILKYIPPSPDHNQTLDTLNQLFDSQTGDTPRQLSLMFNHHQLPLIAAFYLHQFGPNVPIPDNYLLKKIRRSLTAMIICICHHCAASTAQLLERRLTLTLGCYNKYYCRGRDQCNYFQRTSRRQRRGRIHVNQRQLQSASKTGKEVSRDYVKSDVRSQYDMRPRVDQICAEIHRQGLVPRTADHDHRMGIARESKAYRNLEEGRDPFLDAKFPILKLKPDDLLLIIDLYEMFFGRRLLGKQFCRKTLYIRRSLQCMLICFADHFQYDMGSYRQWHRTLPPRTFHASHCRGGPKCGGCPSLAPKARLRSSGRNCASSKRPKVNRSPKSSPSPKMPSFGSTSSV